MEKGYFSFFCDFIFYAFLIFSISFIWLRYFIHNDITLYLLAFLITISLSLILALIFRKKVNKFKLTKKEKKLKQNYLNYLLFLDNKETTNLVKQFYKDRVIKSCSNYLIVAKENLNLVKDKRKYIKNSEKIIIFYDFSINNLSKNSVISFVKKSINLNIKSIEILSINFDKECFSFAKKIKGFTINLIDFDKLYSEKLKNYEINVSEKLVYEEKNKYTFKELLQIAFNKKKTKTYSLTGLIFLFGAIFFRYNIYYLVFTSIMFIFALISYFNKAYNKT